MTVTKPSKKERVAKDEKVKSTKDNTVHLSDLDSAKSRVASGGSGSNPSVK